MKTAIFILLLILKILKWPTYILLGIGVWWGCGYLVTIIFSSYFDLQPYTGDYLSNTWCFSYGILVILIIEMIYMTLNTFISPLIDYIKEKIMESKDVSENIYNKIIRK